MNEKTVVVDASLAVKWVINEEGTEAALELLERWAEENVSVAAPPLIFIEVTNALYKRVRRGELAIADAAALLEHLTAMGITIQDPDSLHTQALELAGRFDCPAAYDAYYLALAKSLNCGLWTADKRLYNLTSHEFDWVHGL